MAVIFLGLDHKEDGFKKVGKVEDGEIVKDADGELEKALEDMPLQDGFLAAKFDNQILNAALTEDVWEKESSRVYIEWKEQAPEDVEVHESEHGALYYEKEEVRDQ